MSVKSRLPPLKALRALEAIHQTGSVTAAARSLNVSHSAVSHQIKILEDWTSRPLFVRRGRTTLLTVAGQSLAGVVHEAFDSIRHEVDRLPLRVMRNVGIASLPLVATKWLIPRIRRFQQNHPDINLHLIMVQNDHPVTPPPDIEILFAPRNKLIPSDTVLLSGEAVPVCAPQLLEKFNGDKERLISGGPIVYDEDLRMWSSWVSKYGIVREGTEGRDGSGLIVEGSALLQAAAIEGQGIALCRLAFLADDLKTGKLVQLSDKTIDDDWCYFGRCDVSGGVDPDVAAVLQWFKDG